LTGRTWAEEEVVAQSHANDDFRVTLGSQVSWYPKAERWRIEVTDLRR
jgi:hypothetical protein